MTMSYAKAFFDRLRKTARPDLDQSIITLRLGFMKLSMLSFSVAISLALFGRHFFPGEWVSGFGTGWAAASVGLILCIVKRKQRWRLMGWDTFASEAYPLSEHADEGEARKEAIARLQALEVTQPSASSGGQDGIQDRIFIVRPDGTRYRFRGDQP